jgi:hypothetical protein
MVINESQRLYTYLSLFGFPVDAVVANRVLPEEARSKYFDRWLSIQAGHLATARANFDPLPFFEAPLFDREMVGTEMLEQFGKRVFGKTDPAAVLHREKPVEVKKEGRTFVLYMRLPFAEKDRIQVHSRGDELVVQVDNSAATWCCRGPGGRAWPAPASRPAPAGGFEAREHARNWGQSRALLHDLGLLEEADRPQIRAWRSEGVILLCQCWPSAWDLRATPGRGRARRKVPVTDETRP